MRIELIYVQVLRIIPGVKCSVNIGNAYYYSSRVNWLVTQEPKRSCLRIKFQEKSTFKLFQGRRAQERFDAKKY